MNKQDLPTTAIMNLLSKNKKEKYLLYCVEKAIFSYEKSNLAFFDPKKVKLYKVNLNLNKIKSTLRKYLKNKNEDLKKSLIKNAEMLCMHSVYELNARGFHNESNMIDCVFRAICYFVGKTFFSGQRLDIESVDSLLCSYKFNRLKYPKESIENYNMLKKRAEKNKKNIINYGLRLLKA